jgi:protein-export membrane protein SecD
MTPLSTSRRRSTRAHQGPSAYSSCSSSLHDMLLAALYLIFTSLSSRFDRYQAMKYNRFVCMLQVLAGTKYLCTTGRKESQKELHKNMRTRNIVSLIAIAILAIISVYVALPNSPGIHIDLGPISIHRDFEIKQGLDLQGGLQVLLEADLPAEEELESGALGVAAKIIENRVNALGVVEPLVQTQGERRIIIELPGVEDPDQAIAIIKETGLLEFIDAGDLPLAAGTPVRTTYPLLESEGAETQLVQVPVPTDTITQTQTMTDVVFATVLTGAHLKAAGVQANQQGGGYLIAFELTEEGGRIFADYTGRNIGKILSIVLDKEVISSPVIKSQIPDGQGVIEGDFTLEEAQGLVVQLRYGALPVPLRVETTRAIGPTLGQDSVQRSIEAGTVGLIIVLLFMLIYYRLPGFLADLALVFYGLLNLAVYEAGWPVLLLISLVMILNYLLDRKDVWPLVLGGILLLATFGLAVSGFRGVTLTLPAITGFILSTGMAVDANILVFERMKEELRAGRSLDLAMEAGFSRAWTSIRDSNISTLITCAILFYFGSTFGAGTVRGFAITLALGVIINMFTAITVTRTFMRVVFDWLGDRLESKDFLLGV